MKDEVKEIKIEKEKVKIFMFADDKIMYIKKLKIFTKNRKN